MHKKTRLGKFKYVIIVEITFAIGMKGEGLCLRINLCKKA
jgi:hypothetical protein